MIHSKKTCFLKSQNLDAVLQITHDGAKILTYSYLIGQPWRQRMVSASNISLVTLTNLLYNIGMPVPLEKDLPMCGFFSYTNRRRKEGRAVCLSVCLSTRFYFLSLEKVLRTRTVSLLSLFLNTQYILHEEANNVASK